MNDFFVIPRLGLVKVEDRLVDHDGPLLFTIRTDNGGRFIALLTCEEDGHSIYWFSAISDGRYRELLRGEMDLRSAFADSDVLEVWREDRTGRYLEPVWLAREKLPQDTLPEIGYRLKPG
jgi:hypothetical protein